MFAGDVEVDEVLTKDDVGDAISIICNLLDITKGNRKALSFRVA